jgi:two-component system chemotaxis response regulator CheY
MQHSSTLPDVVVTDWQLPEMDGLTFRKKMLADHRLKEVPAIVLSASKIKEEKRIEGQIATCIFKAGLIEPLLDAINDCLSSKVTAKVATSP